jgi:hypothetical protein
MREYLPITHFGQNEQEQDKKRAMRVTDLYDYTAPIVADDDEFLGHDFCSISNITTNAPVAEVGSALTAGYRPRGVQAVTLEMLMDDQDDVLGPIPVAARSSKGHYDADYVKPPILGLGKNLVFLLNHLDSDATKLLQYQVRATGLGSTLSGPLYWDGSAWTATATWIDVTGSATQATFLDAVATHTSYELTYDVYLRPKTDYAAETSQVATIGLVDTMSSLGGALLGAAGSEIYLTAPWPFRIGADTAANTPELNLCIMRSA